MFFLNNSNNGYIKFFSLNSWWKKEFSRKEKKYIISRINNSNLFKFEFNKGIVKNEKSSVSFFLTLCSDIFNNKEEFMIAEAFIEKAILMLTNNIIDQHYAYGTAISIYSKDYENNRKKIIYNSKKQIEISELAKESLKKSFMFPLNHNGYENLIFLLIKANKIKEADILLQKVISQGWLGDWKKYNSFESKM